MPTQTSPKPNENIQAQNLPQPTPTPPAPNSTIYAGIFIRYAASFLDVWIAIIPSMLVSALLTLPIALVSGDSLTQSFDKTPVILIFNSLVTIFVWSYFIFTTYIFGATLGKKTFKLKVITANGQPLTLSKVIIREVPGKMISSFILCLGYLMAVFSKQRQTLHDHLAGTYVIRTEPVSGKTKFAVVLVSIFPILILITMILLVAFAVLFIPKKSLRTNRNFPQEDKSSGFVSTAALARDTQRKNDVGGIATELQYHYSKHGQYPQSLTELSLPTNHNGIQNLPVPPENSEPPTNYGYKICPTSAGNEVIVYTRLEYNSHYWAFKSDINRAEETEDTEIPTCPDFKKNNLSDGPL